MPKYHVGVMTEAQMAGTDDWDRPLAAFDSLAEAQIANDQWKRFPWAEHTYIIHADSEACEGVASDFLCDPSNFVGDDGTIQVLHGRSWNCYGLCSEDENGVPWCKELEEQDQAPHLHPQR